MREQYRRKINILLNIEQCMVSNSVLTLNLDLLTLNLTTWRC